ncbi:hypothetical protein COV24_00660 [candidate division WWE3 bacterium CG10_big_fil_rev_8_21_14_0_10_32_10]|uniref:Peptidoglycan beta-N-acetylmuramidase NamZ C-terminal domain-containing protein n=1 Tax=candidate division WWE3 bacterium CG10_big_fil_rev_8_21_14_0_10_32_10 TaxID=1975090 RepID=A0A2H0RBU3_UNCKA|nr:MAG: hypothetical protein COV24_00660 [candidate division WWE3 bacterium CG10_big_fil_rev_8_21_14_0_10_32_10]
MFQKYTDTTCGGFQIHITDRQQFSPWKLGQALMKCFHQELGPHFSWKKPPYEYEYDRPPIDFINGTDRLRHWVEQPSWQWENLLEMEKAGQENFQATRNNALLY